MSRWLAKGLQWWLRQQVSGVDALTVEVEATNSELWAGRVGRLAVQAEGAIYQGLVLSRVALEAKAVGIQWDFWRRGEDPFTEMITVAIVLELTQEDLRTSLISPLLDVALQEPLSQLAGRPVSLTALTALEMAAAGITWQWGGEAPLILTTLLACPDPGSLTLTCVTSQRQVGLPLGTDIVLDSLTLTQGCLKGEGRLLIRPAGATAG
ncbi:MAG: LmeA family phospholipid-binding protein [Gloeomargaritaceae cyanobacterium C42_A2020_066]|nr:LmeA family phospholipid-binding protein [Gloeomargaritaceae cyanobacterium C42_A2020_066]